MSVSCSKYERLPGSSIPTSLPRHNYDLDEETVPISPPLPSHNYAPNEFAMPLSLTHYHE
jgi:hypothetical protein